MLQDVVDKPFATVTYTEAIALLLAARQDFEYPVQWGADLHSEHERYLTEVAFQRTPLVVTNYPKDIKVGGPGSSTSAWHMKACASGLHPAGPAGRWNPTRIIAQDTVPASPDARRSCAKYCAR